MIKASVIGATGYAGAELTRLLSSHKDVEIISAVSKSFAGKKISEIYRSFAKKDMVLDGDFEKAYESDVVFTALPHKAAQEAVNEFYKRGIKVIDLSADYRYSNVKIYNEWYGEHKYPELNEKAVYGLCEINREKIKNAQVIGNPGCYTTCSILPLYPLLKNGLISDKNIIIDAKSGVSGAGRKELLAYSFSETDENFKAYSVAVHRHTSEIEENLSFAAGKDIKLSFTPHLLPLKRGILATIYANLDKDIERQDVLDAYKMYEGEQFIEIMSEGLPELKYVCGSNNVSIGFVIDKRLSRIVIVSCIDNLIKGAAGQAVQNMNIMFGLEENASLNFLPMYI